MPHTHDYPNNCDVEVPLRKQEIIAGIMALGGKSQFKVPDMPDVVIRLEKELHAHTASVRSFTEIIEANTVIAGELLSVIKSPFYQRGMKANAEEMTTVHHVVKFLGLKKTFELTLAVAIQCLPKQSDLFRIIIDHSADVAVACGEISHFVHGISMEEAFLFGLFRDGGAIAMAAMLEKRYEPFWNKLLTHPVQGIQDEMNAFGARHDYIGVMSARQWGFGATQEEQEMIVAIQEHHNVAEVAHFKNERIRLLVATGMLAEVIVNNVNGQVYMSEESIYMRDMALHVLCIDEETLATIRRNSLSRLIFS